MRSLGPITRGILIAWVALWVLFFLLNRGGAGWLDPLVLDPRAALELRLSAIPGLLGYALLHDPGRTIHLLLNALLFYGFAPEIERLWPRWRFAGFLGAATLAGAAAALLLAALAPAAFSQPVIGGSGLVCAVIAASAAIYPDRIISLIFFHCRLIHLFLVLAGLDLLFLIGEWIGPGSLTAHHVHLAGFACGWMWAGGGWRRGWSAPALFARFSARRAARRSARQRSREAGEEQELDRILAKISGSGLNSLEPSERRFLEKRSRRKG